MARVAKMLPRGQQERKDFPRFGVWTFREYKTNASDHYEVQIAGDIEPIVIHESDLAVLERVGQVSDFHCVTSWSYCNLHWGGYRFRDFYETLIKPRLTEPIELIVFKSHDKYKSSLALEDVLQEDVLLADRLNDMPLSTEHGAPLRLVAPAHYGYKNIKHLRKIEFLRDASNYQPRSPRFTEHPRARVANEERGRYLPGWFYRYLYRPLIDMTVLKMKQS